MADQPIIAFIRPEFALGSLKVTEPPGGANVPGLDLGPSGPHQLDDDFEEGEAIVDPPNPLKTPGPPNLGTARPPVIAADKHYTQVLDTLWAEFDDPEEQTAARLNALLEEVAEEARKVHLLAQDIWDKLPDYKVADSERERYHAEFLAYLKRLHAYSNTLEELSPDSTATQSVFVGLVKRRQGAGPVPDAIMHMYFAQQLGILADHSKEMSDGFTGRVVDALALAHTVTAEAIQDAAEETGEVVEGVINSVKGPWWRNIGKPWLIAAGVTAGGLALGGTVLGAVVASRKVRR